MDIDNYVNKLISKVNMNLGLIKQQHESIKEHEQRIGKMEERSILENT